MALPPFFLCVQARCVAQSINTYYTRHMNENTPQRCGYVAFLGAPNAGKSTLMNRMVGSKLAIVTPKAQTTRSRITGVSLHKNTQIVCLDVPGVFNPGEQKFEKAMVSCAWGGVGDADIVLFMLDAKKGLDEENEAILARLKETGRKAFLVLNKIDTLDTKKLLPLTQSLMEAYAFEQVLMISATKGDGVEVLLDAIAEHMPEGPWLFDEEHLTDVPMRVLSSEITREKCFLFMRQELPYSLNVETESWKEQRDGSVRIEQNIYVEREGQKGIVLGAGGAQLKKIGEAARRDIERNLQCRAHLFLFVKVRENWKDNDEHYQYLGLEKK